MGAGCRQSTMKKTNTDDDSDILLRTVKTRKKAEILELLQYQNLNVKVTDDNGNTVIHLVLENDKLTNEDILEIVEIFLNSGVDPNVSNNDQLTVLHLALGKRLRKIVDLLLKKAIEIDKRGSQSNLITNFFIEHEYQKFNGILELKKDDVSFWNSDEAEKETASFVERLIEKEFDFDAKDVRGQCALDLAFSYNLLHILPVLLENTIDDNYRCGDYKSLFNLLMDKNTLPEPFYNRYAYSITKTLLDIRDSIIIKNDEDLGFIERMISHFPESIEGDNCATSLFHAIMRSCRSWGEVTIDYHLKILGDLIARGVDVNSPNYCGSRPVIWALTSKNLRVLQFLDEKGVDFQIKNSKGQNLLAQLLGRKFRVIRDNKLQELVDFFINKGCDVNEKDKEGTTPLHSAVKLGNRDLVKNLLIRGAEVNCRDKRRMTPLHYVTTEELVQLLLEKGANINAKDVEGNTILIRALSASSGQDLDVASESFNFGSKEEDRPFARVPSTRTRTSLRHQLNEYRNYSPPCEKNKSQSRILDLLLSWNVEVNTLHAIEDNVILDKIMDNMNETILEKLLKHGLKIKENSTFCHMLFEQSYGRMKTLLLQHSIKLKVIKLPCPEEFNRYVQLQDFDETEKECLQEIEKLKDTFINDNTTLYDFIHMDLKSKCSYINNSELKKFVESLVFRNYFPKYAVVVLTSYRQAVVRKELTGQAEKTWLELTEFYLPDICVEQIFEYLSNVDLVGFIDTV